MEKIISQMRFNNLKRKKRGKKKFFYTYDDIGKLLGISSRTARNYAYLRFYNPNKIESIIEYAILSRRPIIVKLTGGKNI